MITLTSDFGLHDPYVGIMKSRIVQRAAHIPVIDLTHEIAPFAIDEAGYWLYCCAPQFPPGTVHVAVVDPGVGSERAILVLEAAGQHFIAPDNGLLGLLAVDADARVYAVDAQALALLAIVTSSQTFHGRDVMAPLAAELACHRVRAPDLGPRVQARHGSLAPAVRAADGSVTGVIAVIDRYGNALTTIGASEISHLRTPRVRCGEREFQLLSTYSKGQPGELLALMNSSRMVELAAREGSAAQAGSLRVGQVVTVHDDRGS